MPNNSYHNYQILYLDPKKKKKAKKVIIVCPYRTIDIIMNFKPYFTAPQHNSKAAFELAVNHFRKSFSVKPACLAATENRISEI